MLVVKIFLDVTDASVNPDIYWTKLSNWWAFLSLKISFGTVTFILPSFQFFNYFITKISPFLRSTSLHFAVLSPKYCLRIFNWVPLSFFIYVHFPIYSLLNTTSHFHIMRIVTFNNQDLDWGPHWKQFWQVKFPHQVIIRK